MSTRSNQVACRSFFESLFGIATRIFEPVLDLWQILKLCRFAVLTVTVAAYLLIWNPQGQEVLIRLRTDVGIGRNIVFLVAVIFWAWAVWYSCRVILTFQFAHWPPRDINAEREARIRYCHLVMPRALGVGTFLVIARAMYKSVENTEHSLTGIVLSILYTACAVLFFLIVWKRHDFAAYFRRRYPRSVKLLGESMHVQPQRLRSYDELPRLRKWGIWAFLIGLSVIPFFIFQTRGINLLFAPHIMSPTILILAATSWVPVGTLLVYSSGHYRIPIFTILIIYLVLISPLNDNHGIRKVPAISGPRPAVMEHLANWLRHKSFPVDGEHALPVVLVATEGGGIRSAYWTASILSRIQSDRPDFASHVFVISGVSGGALGAGIFTALVADLDNKGPCGNHRAFITCAREILRKDFLAPTFATMLYPDLLQRFLFWPIPYWDRARTLEISWEQAWQSVTQSSSNRFAQPFENLWEGPRSYEIPSLILNMTAVEHGNRVLLSNLRIDQTDRAFTCQEAFSGRAYGIFDDVIDLRVAMKSYPCNTPDPLPAPSTVALSTAINNSARFSFISPSGTVNERLHIVDGGYFENSGTTTLEEVYRKIQPTLTKKQVPIVLYISNDAGDGLQIGALYRGPLEAIIEGAPKRCIRIELQGRVPAELGKETQTCPPWPNRRPNQRVIVADMPLRSTLRENQFYTMRLDRKNRVVELYEPDVVHLDEVATPFYTIFRARLARGTHASEHLQHQMRGQGFIPLRLQRGMANLPLGWTLSDEATMEMDQQLDVLFKNCQQAETLLDYFNRCWPNES